MCWLVQARLQGLRVWRQFRFLMAGRLASGVVWNQHSLPACHCHRQGEVRGVRVVRNDSILIIWAYQMHFETLLKGATAPIQTLCS